MNAISSWFAKYSVWTHVVAAFVFLVGAFNYVPQFHAVVLQIYGLIPAWAQTVVLTAIALYAWYRNGEPTSTASTSATNTTGTSTGAKLVSLLLVSLLGSAMAVCTSGCTASEVNGVVTKIAAEIPTVISLAREALTIYEAVGTSSTETASVTAKVTTINTDLSQLQTLTDDYLAASSSAAKTTAWSNIDALVDTLATDADTVLATASVKNSDSKAAGVVVLASLDAAVHILDAYVSSTQSTSTVDAKLAKRTIKLRQVSALWSPQDQQRVADVAGVPYDVALRYAEARGF